MLPDVDMRDVAEIIDAEIIDARAAHAHAADALADGLQRLGSDAAFSADTGDDVASARVLAAVDSDDSDAGGDGGGLNRVLRHIMAPLQAPAGTTAAPAGPEFLQPPHFLDIVRPGTVLCNGVIELPECVPHARRPRTPAHTAPLAHAGLPCKPCITSHHMHAFTI